MYSWKSITAGLQLGCLTHKNSRFFLMFCKMCVCSWWMFCLLYHCLFECLSRHSGLIHNLCKVMQEGSDVFASEFYLSSTQHLSLLPLLLLLLLCSSLSCVPRYSLISLLSAPLINCACFSRPETAWCSPLHPLFVVCDLQGSLFLNILTLSLSLLLLLALLPPSISTPFPPSPCR